jgi:hypothetical protein
MASTWWMLGVTVVGGWVLLVSFVGRLSYKLGGEIKLEARQACFKEDPRCAWLLEYKQFPFYQHWSLQRTVHTFAPLNCRCVIVLVVRRFNVWIKQLSIYTPSRMDRTRQKFTTRGNNRIGPYTRDVKDQKRYP